MTTPQALHHSLLRPCVLHILRAAGYHSTKPSVLDTLTDLAARYMYLLAQSTATHAAVNDNELEVSIEDVRMAMQDCGALAPETVLEDEDYEGEEDMSGVENFLAWVTGKANKEIRRVALEGGDGKEDYLTGSSRSRCKRCTLIFAVLKKKHSTADEESRYAATLLGKGGEPRAIKVEGGDIESVKDWVDRLKTTSKRPSTTPTTSRPQSSGLSSLGDSPMEDMEF
jgi:transcription initiation factor TFIID subunit 3